LCGTPGGGKTLLATAAGISQLLDANIYKRVGIARPIEPLGRDIGYLPGSVEEKLDPWMKPIQDQLDLLFSDKGAAYLSAQQDDGRIQVEPLTYIRGRSIPKSYILVDETQNLTKHEIKTIITRMGEDAKLVLTGDIMQIDNPYIDSVDNGLSCVIEAFKDDPIAAHVTLKKGERSLLATIASEKL
jgi:PhoH-like ATPase